MLTPEDIESFWMESVFVLPGGVACFGQPFYKYNPWYNESCELTMVLVEDGVVFARHLLLYLEDVLTVVAEEQQDRVISRALT